MGRHLTRVAPLPRHPLLSVCCPLLLLGLIGCSSPSKSSPLLTCGYDLHPAAERLRSQANPPPCIARELDRTVAEPYIVEPGDVLLVQPARLDSPLRLPGDQVVLPDGTIQLGRFGRVQVAGKTLDQVEVEVNNHFRTQSPECGPVVVRLATRDSKVFYVQGEVNAPGAFPLRGRETVLDAIVCAGGLNSNASRRRILLARPTPPCSCRVVLPVDYNAIVQLGDTTTNYQVRAGDRIFVPTRSYWEELCCAVKEKLKGSPPVGCSTACEGGSPTYSVPPSPPPPRPEVPVPGTLVPPGAVDLPGAAPVADRQTSPARREDDKERRDSERRRE